MVEWIGKKVEVGNQQDYIFFIMNLSHEKLHDVYGQQARQNPKDVVF